MEKHPQYANLRLIVIGDELDAYPAVRHAVIKSRVQESVRFLGFVPVETLRCFYDAAVAFAFPSLYEGFGLPIVESMSLGVPVITANRTSTAEVGADSALLIDPTNQSELANAMVRVANDSELRSKMSEAGIAIAKRHTWERFTERVLKVLIEE